jgi:hypothetical protein
VSVDTYLRGKSLSLYRKVVHDEFELLVAPALYSQSRSIKLDVRDFLFWRSLRAEAEPLDDHFHSPACDH